MPPHNRRHNKATENQVYCTAAFLDMSQVSDKVWHSGLLFKIKRILPSSYFNLLKSYLNDHQFETKFNGETSSRFHIHSGVPQGSILGPLLYCLYTSDLPTPRETTLGTFADDTAIFATHEDPTIASLNLQEHLHIIKKWLKKWKIQVIAHKIYPPEKPLPCSQYQPNHHTSNRSSKIPRTTFRLQVKLERTHNQGEEEEEEEEKKIDLKTKRDQLVNRKIIPSIYRKQITHLQSGNQPLLQPVNNRRLNDAGPSTCKAPAVQSLDEHPITTL
jgi:hypothetical protein